MFFSWLANEYGTPNPYDDKALNRYAPGDTESPVLPDELIVTLLEVTAGSDHESRRDHAIIRLFLTGIRREQMTRLRMEDLDLPNRTVRIAGLKGHPDHYVAFGHKTAHALSRWLRVRATNPYAESATTGRLWLATRNRGALTSNGIYQTLRRRAEQAGYDRSAIRNPVRTVGFRLLAIGAVCFLVAPPRMPSSGKAVGHRRSYPLGAECPRHRCSIYSVSSQETRHRHRRVTPVQPLPGCTRRHDQVSASQCPIISARFVLEDRPPESPHSPVRRVQRDESQPAVADEPAPRFLPDGRRGGQVGQPPGGAQVERLEALACRT